MRYQAALRHSILFVLLPFSGGSTRVCKGIYKGSGVYRNVTTKAKIAASGVDAMGLRA